MLFDGAQSVPGRAAHTGVGFAAQDRAELDAGGRLARAHAVPVAELQRRARLRQAPFRRDDVLGQAARLAALNRVSLESREPAAQDELLLGRAVAHCLCQRVAHADDLFRILQEALQLDLLGVEVALRRRGIEAGAHFLHPESVFLRSVQARVRAIQLIRELHEGSIVGFE